jgi:hypothetical protein
MSLVNLINDCIVGKSYCTYELSFKYKRFSNTEKFKYTIEKDSTDIYDCFEFNFKDIYGFSDYFMMIKEELDIIIKFSCKNI